MEFLKLLSKHLTEQIYALMFLCLLYKTQGKFCGVTKIFSLFTSY